MFSKVPLRNAGKGCFKARWKLKEELKCTSYWQHLGSRLQMVLLCGNRLHVGTTVPLWKHRAQRVPSPGCCCHAAPPAAGLAGGSPGPGLYHPCSNPSWGTCELRGRRRTPPVLPSPFEHGEAAFTLPCPCLSCCLLPLCCVRGM